MTDEDRNKWDEKYAARSTDSFPIPDDWLLKSVEGLVPGRALELACGLGQNAMALAELGWQVDAIDISRNGLDLAAAHAASRNLDINWICADLDHWVPDEQYDLIVLFRFLDWEAIPSIVKKCLKTDGLFCYETFSHSQMDRADNHLKNSKFTIKNDDFSRYFPFLSIEFCEYRKLVDRDVARFLGRAKSI